MIDRQIKRILEEGFKPWGVVIPNPVGAPKGSAVFQFRRRNGKKYDEAVFVIDPKGHVIRGQVGVRI